MMDGDYVTTPFGRRPLTLGMLASQAAARRIEPGASIDKWKLFRSLCEARPLLGISDRALAVLNALLSFYPKTEICAEHGLVVFPSNAQLSLRSHGMSGTTLRRHLAGLVEAGLLIRKDSPNGKRYARKGRDGEIGDAFGFSLAPLVTRAVEIERLAAGVVAERLALQQLRERVSLCRRDIAKLIEVGVEEAVSGSWADVHQQFRLLLTSLPRRPSGAELTVLLDALETLRLEILNILESKINSIIPDVNAVQNGHHIQSSNTDPHESEPASKNAPGEIPVPTKRSLGGERFEADISPFPAGPDRRPRSQAANDGHAFPLPMVLRACPDIAAYGPGGTIAGWRDLMAAAVVVRSMLGVSPSAYQEACDVLGAENAAIIIACILERAVHITSAGGYLRGLVRRAERGEFSIGPMLMALLRSNGGAGEKTG